MLLLTCRTNVYVVKQNCYLFLTQIMSLHFTHCGNWEIYSHNFCQKLREISLFKTYHCHLHKTFFKWEQISRFSTLWSILDDVVENGNAFYTEYELDKRKTLTWRGHNLSSIVGIYVENIVKLTSLLISNIFV